MSYRKKGLQQLKFGGTGKDMEVHHIKMQSEGGSDRSDNLIPLPKQVHRNLRGHEKEEAKRLKKWKKGRI